MMSSRHLLVSPVSPVSLLQNLGRKALSPESDLDISDREVSSNATTAVSPQTPLDALDPWLPKL